MNQTAFPQTANRNPKSASEVVALIWVARPGSSFMGVGTYEGTLPRGSKVVPFWGSYIESYKVLPKRNYYGAYG